MIIRSGIDHRTLPRPLETTIVAADAAEGQAPACTRLQQTALDPASGRAVLEGLAARFAVR